jgi:hypothetical protein
MRQIAASATRFLPVWERGIGSLSGVFGKEVRAILGKASS